MDDAELGRARILVSLDRDAEARQVLARLLAAEPGHAEALCLYAQACLGMSELDDAARAARAATQYAPYDEWPFRLLALVHARQGVWQQAQAAADRAIQLDPDGWRPHLARAQVDLMCRKVGPATEASARQAVRLAPMESETHRVLGNVLLETKQAAEGKLALRAALRLDPQSAGARNDLARADMRRSIRVGRAAVGFADAAALDPSSDIAVGNLVLTVGQGVRVVHLILWVVIYTIGRWASDSHHGNRVLALVAFCVAAVSIGTFGMIVWRDSRPRTLQLLGIVLRRDRLLAAWLGCLLAAFVFLSAAPFIPHAAISVALGLSATSLVTGWIVSWARRRRVRRRLRAR